MENSKGKNLAFIDGQNLYMNTAKKEKNPWLIDLARFHVYLQKKYNVDKAYYRKWQIVWLVGIVFTC